MKIVFAIICLLLVSSVSAETKGGEGMDKLNKEIRELVQNIKSNDKDLEEEILFNTIKIYSQNQNQIDQFY